MGKDIVLIHGAFAGPWCMDSYAGFFRERGWTVHTPAFRGHGANPSEEPAELNGASVLDYVEDVAAAVAAADTKPVLLGHAIGGVVAQKLAARGLASAVVLINPNAPYGTLPATDDERAVARGLMEGGAFWKAPMRVPFEMFREFAFNKLPEDQARATYDRLGAESGKVMFEMFFWMFDDAAATKVDFEAVDCPVLVVSGAEDRAVNPASGRDLAARYGARGTFLAAEGHGHFLFLEPGWENVVAQIEAWLTEVL